MNDEVPSGRLARAEPMATGALIGVAVGAFIGHAIYLAVPAVDDAAISVAYGMTWLRGDGIRLTPFSQPVEGFSNPLWTAIVGLASLFTSTPVGAAEKLGIFFGAASLPVVALWGAVAGRRALQLQDALAPLVAAASPTFVYWAAAGLESGLHALLLAALGVLVLRELDAGKGALCGAVVGLLALTRPEWPLYAAAAGLFWGVHRATAPRPSRLPRWQELKIAAGIAAFVGAWQLLRWRYFASPLPNTYYAKQDWQFEWSAYLTGFFERNQALVVLCLGGALLGLVGGRLLLRGVLLAALLASAGVVFIYKAHGDWMREWRFIAPIIPICTVAPALGACAVRVWIAKLKWPKARIAAGALLFAAVCAACYPALRLCLRRAPEVKASPELPYAFIARTTRERLAPFAAMGMKRLLVAMPDIGGLSVDVRNAEVIDAAGLADYALARTRPNHPAMEDYLLNEGLPVLVDAHGPSGHIGTYGKLMAHYAGGVLRGLSAEEDPRCPGGKAATVALTPDALADKLSALIDSGQPLVAIGHLRCAQAWLDPERLPAPNRRRRLSALAEARAGELKAAGEGEKALRFLSLATLLADGDAHLRRRTEKLRLAVFPAK